MLEKVLSSRLRYIETVLTNELEFRRSIAETTPQKVKVFEADLLEVMKRSKIWKNSSLSVYFNKLVSNFIVRLKKHLQDSFNTAEEIYINKFSSIPERLQSPSNQARFDRDYGKDSRRKAIISLINQCVVFLNPERRDLLTDEAHHGAGATPRSRPRSDDRAHEQRTGLAPKTPPRAKPKLAFTEAGAGAEDDVTSVIREKPRTGVAPRLSIQPQQSVEPRTSVEPRMHRVQPQLQARPAQVHQTPILQATPVQVHPTREHQVSPSKVHLTCTYPEGIHPGRLYPETEVQEQEVESFEYPVRARTFLQHAPSRDSQIRQQRKESFTNAQAAQTVSKVLDQEQSGFRAVRHKSSGHRTQTRVPSGFSSGFMGRHIHANMRGKSRGGNMLPAEHWEKLEAEEKARADALAALKDAETDNENDASKIEEAHQQNIAELLAIEKEQEKMKQRLQQYKELVREQNEELKVVRDQVQTVTADKESLARKQSSLEAQLNKTQNELFKVKGELASLQLEHTKMLNSMVLLNEGKSTIEDALTHKQEEVDTLSQLKREIKKKFASIDKESKEAVEKSETVKAEEIKKVQEQATADLKTAREEARAQLEQVDNKLKLAQKDLETYQAKHKAATNQIDALTAKLKTSLERQKAYLAQSKTLAEKNKQLTQKLKEALTEDPDEEVDEILFAFNAKKGSSLSELADKDKEIEKDAEKDKRKAVNGVSADHSEDEAGAGAAPPPAAAPSAAGSARFL